MPSSFRLRLAVFAAAILFVPFLSAFQTPLSDEDIRDAYFLGQRNDEATARAFLSYLKMDVFSPCRSSFTGPRRTRPLTAT